MKMRIINWKVKCKKCDKYYEKKDMHIISQLCYKCHPKRNIINKRQCKGITREGNRCKNSGIIAGLCNEHYKKKFKTPRRTQTHKGDE